MRKESIVVHLMVHRQLTLPPLTVNRDIRMSLGRRRFVFPVGSMRKQVFQRPPSEDRLGLPQLVDGLNNDAIYLSAPNLGPIRSREAWVRMTAEAGAGAKEGAAATPPSRRAQLGIGTHQPNRRRGFAQFWESSMYSVTLSWPFRKGRSRDISP